MITNRLRKIANSQLEQTKVDVFNIIKQELIEYFQQNQLDITTATDVITDALENDPKCIEILNKIDQTLLDLANQIDSFIEE